MVALSSILVYSCSKNATNISKNKVPKHANIYTMADGEDGDIIIINHKIVDINGVPIPGCGDTLTDGINTFTGITDNTGVCVFHIPSLGVWDLSAGHDGYLPLHVELHVVDSSSSRIDMMLVH